MTVSSDAIPRDAASASSRGPGTKRSTSTPLGTTTTRSGAMELRARMSVRIVSDRVTTASTVSITLVSTARAARYRSLSAAAPPMRDSQVSSRKPRTS